MLRAVTLLFCGLCLCLLIGCKQDRRAPIQNQPPASQEGGGGGTGAGGGNAGSSGGDMEMMAGDPEGSMGMDDMGMDEMGGDAEMGGGMDMDMSMDMGGDAEMGGDMGGDMSMDMGMGDMMGDMGEGGGYATGPPATKPETYDGLAEYSFKWGTDREAFQYLYAHALSNPEGAADLLATIQWIPKLERPSLAVRFGVGVELTAPPDTKDYKPIGTTQQLPTRGGRGGRGGQGGGEDLDGGGGMDIGGGGGMDIGGGGGMDIGGGGGMDMGGGGGMDMGGGGMMDMGGGMDGGGGGGPARNPSAPIKKYVGEFGEKIVAELKSRIEQGSFGRVLKDALAAGGGAPAGGGGYGDPGAMDMGGSMDMQSMDQGAGRGRGGPQAGTAETQNDGEANGRQGRAGRQGRGANAQARSGGRQGRSSGRQGGRQEEEEPEAKPERMMAGVIFLGVGDSRELLAKAKDEGLDVMLLFRITVKPNPKTRLVINETDVVLSDAQKRTRFHGSRKLNNINVQKARAEEKPDSVDREVERLFAFIDENLVMTELPADYSPEKVLDRLRAVLQESHDDYLPVLTEIRFWNSREMLSDEHMLAALKALIRNDAVAVQLATGSEEEKKEILAKLLPSE